VAPPQQLGVLQASAKADADGQAPVAHIVEGAQLFGQVGGIVVGSHQHRGPQPHLLGDGGGIAKQAQPFQRRRVAHEPLLDPNALVFQFLGPRHESLDQLHIHRLVQENLGDRYP